MEVDAMFALLGLRFVFVVLVFVLFVFACFGTVLCIFLFLSFGMRIVSRSHS